MAAVNPGVYKAILKVREAYEFDVGGLLMRLYYYMTNIGVVTMLTLSGYAFFTAGLVSSTIALSVFLISPRISKLVDKHGQARVVPVAACLPVAGTAGMLVAVTLSSPVWVFFPLAVLMGSIPSPQALVRARWTYLLRTGKLKGEAPALHVVFSYEAVIDDIGFMVSPSLSIFLASTIAPVAGMAFGIIAFAVGAVLLSLSRSTQPEPGWKPVIANGGKDAGKGAAEPEGIPGAASDSPVAAATAEGAWDSNKSVFRLSSTVRVLFALMFFLGAFFGSLDTSTVSLAENLGNPNIASIALAIQALISATMGFVFGMVNLPMRQYAQLVLTAVLFGVSFACTAFVDSAATLFAITFPASLFYAPFLITANAACERAVPGSRFTEAITWVNTGVTCGMALGPTTAGALIDALGTHSSFVVGGILAATVAVLALLFRNTLKRTVR